MEHTGLTIGGFIQAKIARGIIESTANVEKGLIQRFQWIFPIPYPKKFEELKTISTTFSDSVGKEILHIANVVLSTRSLKW